MVVGLVININTDRPASFKAAGLHSRHSADSNCSTRQLSLDTRDPTHCSCDKHLARPHTNKKKQTKTIFLPCLVCLLGYKSVNK